MRGDTTEAMRAAFEAWAKAYGRIFLDRQPSGNYRHVFTQEAWVGWQAALAHPTPAAPAVTDSTHTGAVPDAATERYCLSCEKLGHRTDECWSTHGLNTPQARELHRLCVAAQSSPERNDCEPFAWAHPDGRVAERGAVETMRRAGGASASALRGYTVPLYRHPPPPAERHYCERCGKRLGSTQGVHACTPPGDVS